MTLDMKLRFDTAVAVLGNNIWRGLAPYHLGGNNRLSEITIEPIKNLGAWARFGWTCAPRPQHRPRTATATQAELAKFDESSSGFFKSRDTIACF